MKRERQKTEEDEARERLSSRGINTEGAHISVVFMQEFDMASGQFVQRKKIRKDKSDDAILYPFDESDGK